MVGRKKQILPVLELTKIRPRCLKLVNKHLLGPWWKDEAIRVMERILQEINDAGIEYMAKRDWTKIKGLNNAFVVLEMQSYEWDGDEFEERLPGAVDYVKESLGMDDAEWKKGRRDFVMTVLYKLKTRAPREDGKLRIQFVTPKAKTPNAMYKDLYEILRAFDFREFPTQQSLTDQGGIVGGIRFLSEEFLSEENDRILFGEWESRTIFRTYIDGIEESGGTATLDTMMPSSAAVSGDDNNRTPNRTPNGTPNRTPNRTPIRTPNSTSNRTPNRNRYSLSVSPGKVYSRLKEGIKNTVSGCRSGAGNVLSSSDRALVRELGGGYRVGKTNTQTTNSVVVAASSQYERVRRDFHSTIEQVSTAAAIGTPPPLRRISNDNGSSANTNRSGSGRGADNDHQQQQLSDDSNIEQVPAASATTAASIVHTNEPVVVDDDATISNGFVNHRTQNGSTSLMNEQETEGTHSADDSNLDQELEEELVEMTAYFSSGLRETILRLQEKLDRPRSDLHRAEKDNIALREAAVAAAARLEDLNDSVQTLQDEKRASTEQHAAAIDALRAEFEASEAVLRAEIIDRNDTIHQQEATITQREATICQRTAERDSSKRSVDELGESFARHEEIIIERNASIATLEIERTNRQGVIHQSKLTIDALREERETLNKKIFQYETTHADLREQNKNLRGTITRDTVIISNLQETIRENAVRHEEDKQAMVLRITGFAETEQQQLARNNNNNNNNNGDNRNDNV